MSFLAGTFALIAGALAIPALLALYFLKRRRRLVAVSSTFLWRKAIQDMQVNAPFQRIRRNLLLLLQLLALLGLLFALARPTLRQVASEGQRTVIVIDHSASMNAMDVSPSRLAVAKDEALNVIEDLSGGAAMVISFAQQAKVVQPFTSDRSRLRAAVRAIEPTDQLSRIEPALRLIEPFAMEESDEPLVVYVLSDGKVEKAGQLTLRGAELRYVKIGKEAGNVGIVALAARRDFDQPQRVHVFARLANSGDAPVSTRVTMTLDGQAYDVRSANLNAQSDVAVNFTFDAAGGAFVRVRHDHQDSMAVDDSGSLAIAPPQRLNVLLVSEGNRFLMRALRAAGVHALSTITPTEYENDPSAAQAADVVVFDRWSPPEVPVVQSLVLGAALPIEGMAIKREEDGEPQAILEWRRDHPLLRHVAMQELKLAERVRLSLPDAAQALAYAEAGPVMATVQVENVRHVVVGFDVLQSNWPMQIAFPVFITNALDWLAIGGASEAGRAYRPGDVAVVPAPPGASQVVYTGPMSIAAPVRGGRAVLPAFEQVGVYVAQTDVQDSWRQLPVNLASATESDVRPADVLDVGTQSVDAINAQSQAVRREVWRWFVWAALVLVMVEWVVYVRRMHL